MSSGDREMEVGLQHSYPLVIGFLFDKEVVIQELQHDFFRVVDFRDIQTTDFTPSRVLVGFVL